jgi:antibiotic biosynthesis monooxygenase (ABM) superfamily enzyme
MGEIQSHGSSSHVDFIVHLIVRRERCAELEELQQKFVEAASTFPGYQLSSTDQIDGAPDGYQAYVAVHRFDRPKDLIEWMESDTRRSLVKATQAQLHGDLTVDYPLELAGFSSWFANPNLDDVHGKKPSVWKQSLIVMVALYPLTLIIGALVGVVIPNAHPATTRLIVTVIAVNLMGFFLVPTLCGCLSPWLRSKKFWSQFIGAISLISILLFLWIMMHVFMAYPNKATDVTPPSPEADSTQPSSVSN